MKMLEQVWEVLQIFTSERSGLFGCCSIQFGDEFYVPDFMKHTVKENALPLFKIESTGNLL
jgi:hypothetical protein